jgi:hypothetical protein
LTFEQSIASELDGAPALLRIQASFLESPAGVAVALRAQEIRVGPNVMTQVQDVTRRYRDNLFNALDALAAKWGLGSSAQRAGAPTSAGSGPEPITRRQPVVRTEPVPRPAADRQPALDTDGASGKPPDYRVGSWAYYAERYAETQGCALGELGAVLEAQHGGIEVHRVHCADGRQLRVRCSDQGCGAGD